VVGGGSEVVVKKELEMLVKRDLMEVIDTEFERIASIYREINKLCSIVDIVRVNAHVEVHSLSVVMDELPVVRSVYFIFSGDRVVKVDYWEYDVVVVGDKHDHVIGLIEVAMFGDRCYIMKDIDTYELERVVEDIVNDLLKGLPEEELKDG
jgi:hypothetical protein